MVYMIVLTSRVFGEQCLCVGEKCSNNFLHTCVLLFCSVTFVCLFVIYFHHRFR